MSDAKVCTRCGKEYPATPEYFYKQKSGKYGVYSRCKKCYNETRREYGRSERRKVTQRKYNKTGKAKSGALKYLYGITSEQYNQMFLQQEGCCAICGKHQSEFKRALCVDHNHETGEIRGLLCSKCNLGLGNFKDDSEILKKAIMYVAES